VNNPSQSAHYIKILLPITICDFPFVYFFQ